MLHSVVGLAAVLTSIGSVLGNLEHVSTLHLVTAYLGVVIGNPPLISIQKPRLMLLFRWYNVYWVDCCFLKISRSHVV